MALEDAANSTVRQAMDQGRQAAETAGRQLRTAMKQHRNTLRKRDSISTFATSFAVNRG